MKAMHTTAMSVTRGSDTRCIAARTATPNGPTASIAFCCAARAIVRAVPPPESAGDPDRPVASPRGKLIAKLRVHRAAIADVLVPAVSAIEHHGDRVLLAGYSTFDAVSAPRTVFALLSRLDGATPWRTALAALADPALDAALVRALRRVGALRDPAGSDDPPETE